MAEERIIIEISDEALDAELEKMDRALEGTQSVDEAVEEILGKKEEVPTKEELAGVEAKLKSVLLHIPELRELTRMVMIMERFAGVSGVLTPLLLSLPYLLTMVNQIRVDIDNIKRRQLDYERMLAEARGFTLRDQVLAWQEEYHRQLHLEKRGDSPL